MNFSSPSSSVKPHLGALDIAVLHTLMYFDIFRHPLTTDEIHRNCQWQACSLSDIAVALESLLQYGIIGNAEGFWFLSGNNKIISLRLERQERALQFQSKAKKYSRRIASFPFVRGVSVSGSLSKGTMDINGDIDYFIITEPGRLWVARTLLVLYKKVFLLNSKKYFCVNYFIDTDRLTIPDRNLFVATEIAFLRPMVNRKLYEEFVRSNKWVNLMYPNREVRARLAVSEVASGFIKRNVEKMLSKNFGEWLDEKCLRITMMRWKKKFPHLSNLEFDLDFRSKKNVSKHHPQGFQRKVVVEIEKRKEMILEQYGILVPSMQWEWSSENESVNKA